MTNFAYQGLFKGKQTTGSVEADSRALAMGLLQKQSIIVTNLKPQKKSLDGEIKTFMGMQLASDKLKDMEILMFTKKLETMIKADLPIMDALILSRKQAKKPGLIKVTRSLVDDLNQGLTFSDGLKKFPQYFDSSYVSMVKAGESSGTLAAFLKKICDLVEKKLKIINDIKSALTYPMILLSVAGLVTALMLIKVVPVFQKIYGSMGVALPGATQTVINMSQFLRDPSRGGILGLLILAIVSLIVFLTKKTYLGKKIFHSIILKIPALGELIKKSIFAKLSLVLANLLSAGVTIIDALEISSKVTNNVLIRESMARIQKDILTGKNLSELFLNEPIFPMEFSEFMKVGEKTGSVGDMFSSIAIYYEAEVDASVGKLKQLVEPVMIVLIGIIIGTLLLTLYQPIFSLGSVIK